MSKPKVINLYGGPCAGKSTLRAAVFAELKFQEYQLEEILEYAKDAAWQKRGIKLFRAQDYIFGKQHFRLNTVTDEVDLVITDSPILMSQVYIGPNWPMPSLRGMIDEAYAQYNNLDIFIDRGRNYDPKGRNQTEQEAIEIDDKILNLLEEKTSVFYRVKFGREAVFEIIELMKNGKFLPARE